MGLFDSAKPAWTSLLEKLKGKRSPVYDVYEVNGAGDLQTVRNALSAFLSRNRSFSVILVKD